MDSLYDLQNQLTLLSDNNKTNGHKMTIWSPSLYMLINKTFKLFEIQHLYDQNMTEKYFIDFFSRLI